MNEELKSNLTSPELWVRLVYMALFAFFLYIASFVVVLVVVGQFLFSLLTGSDNKKLRNFGNSAATYFHQVLMFLTFNSEDKAFPFADWPAPVATDDSAVFHEPEDVVAEQPDEPTAAVAATNDTPTVSNSEPDVKEPPTQSSVIEEDDRPKQDNSSGASADDSTEPPAGESQEKESEKSYT